MKHYTILPQYKNNKFVDTWIYWYKQFVCALDYEVWSLIDYLYIYNPNYILFNQNEKRASYFTKEDLITLGLLTENKEENSSTITSLTVDATKLLPHTGLINDYLQQYNDVEIYWGTDPDTQEDITQPFKEAEIIIFNSTDTTQNTNKSKFLIGRLTAGNSFYIPKVLGQELHFIFVKNAEETYGNTQYFNLYSPRFNITEKWTQSEHEKGITLINNLVAGTGDIQSKNALWTGNEELNHNFYYRNNNNYEEVITDSVQITGFVNKQNPYYTINIENGQKLPSEWLNYYIW